MTLRTLHNHPPLTVGSLFSGIGMIEYGLEQAGMRTVWQVEREPYCRAVLEKHWPDVPRFDDVKTFPTADVVRPDVICGGFPCQPHSTAGKRKGAEDERNLWPDFARIIGHFRPDWVLAENVPGLRGTMVDRVLEDLEGLGYAVWPVVVGADDIGAPHRRKRVWIVGNTDATRRGGRSAVGGAGERSEALGPLPAIRRAGVVADGPRQHGQQRPNGDGVGTCRDDDSWMANTESGRLGAGRGTFQHPGHVDQCGESRNDDWQFEAVERVRRQWPARPGQPQFDWEATRLVESGVGGAVDGRTRRVAGFARKQALRALGNSVVWIIPYLIGTWICNSQP